MNQLMLKLHVIANECNVKTGDGKKPKGTSQDAFSVQKREIAEKLREVRVLLKERDELLAVGGKDNKKAVEKAQAARLELREVRLSAQKLKEIDRKTKKGKGTAEEEEEKASHRKEVIENIFAHIEECERIQKRRYESPANKEANSARADLFAGARSNDVVLPDDPTQTDLKDIDFEDDEESMAFLQRKAEREAQMDRDLDEIHQGVQGLKELSLEMNRELDVQGQMIHELDQDLDKTNQHLYRVNKKLTKMLDDTSDKFAVYFILIVVLLAIGMYTYSQVSKNT